MRTFNRGRLLRLAEAGKLVAVSTYSFDDMYGGHRTNNDMPVKMMPADRCQCQDGTVYVFPSYFKGKSGTAYYAHDDRQDLVTLIVHSNCNYTFRILP